MTFIGFKVKPISNHEFFFTYDAKKDKALLGQNGLNPPIVYMKDDKRRAGIIKIVCVEYEPFISEQYRLHRHQLIDCKSDKTDSICYCDEFGVAEYGFKSFDYNNENEIYIELKSLTIRRINGREFKTLVKKWNNERNKRFDPFNIGFSEGFKKKIDLNCVRLCCQAFFDDNQTSKPILSDKIQNCKTEIKVHQWDAEIETKISGGDKFYVFISELKTDQREVNAHFFDENGQEFGMVKPDYIHSNRAIRLTVPPHPLNRIQNIEKESLDRISSSFFLASVNKNYKSEVLSFYYIPDFCLICSPNKRLCEDPDDIYEKRIQRKDHDLFFHPFDGSTFENLLNNLYTNTSEDNFNENPIVDY